MTRINKVAVLGSGVMGSGIAALLAGVGLEVLLLDIVPFNLSEEEAKSKDKRNSIVNAALQAALKAKPAAFYDAAFAERITTGNFDDDFEKISDCDWIIEVVVERLDIKQQIFEKVDKYRKIGSLITSNTSGIPIHLMAQGRSEDFQAHFCGTHFFNPPRYLKLLEIIPTPQTKPEVINFFMDYGSTILGKETVLCKDTPAFIANRVGVYAMAKIFQLAETMNLSIEAVDSLTGPAIGRPNTGTFRLADLVGLDTADKVIKGIVQNCPQDEQAPAFTTPKYLEFLLENKWYGNKSKKGFYEKTKDKDPSGKPIVLALDLQTLEYKPSQKVKFPSVEAAKQVEHLGGKIRTFFKMDDQGAKLIQESLLGLFSYVSNRIPEISDNLYSIDDALRAGFAWEAGPFEYWDMVGVAKATELARQRGLSIAPWVDTMLEKGIETFYKVINGQKHFYNINTQSYQALNTSSQIIVLDDIRDKSVVWENAETQIHDLGDQVLCVEFRSKANSIGGGVLEGINKAIDLAEQGDWRGVVIGNNAQQFSVGANLMMIAMMAYEQEFDELEYAVRMFQNTTMRARYSSVPVVVATQGYVFGGGCELSLHADKVIAAAESYIGLVEVGVGLIPGGGGTKEFALRAAQSFFEGDVQIPTIIERFKTIAMASVATSAHEAFKFGYLRPGIDQVTLNTKRNIGLAKEAVINLSNAGYVRPAVQNNIQVLGRGGLGALYTAAESLRLGKYASEHDIKIAKKVAYVLCGGDLSAPQGVSEQYLLDIEREAFLSLCGEEKTLERIQHMLTTNKPLRN